MTEYKIQTKIGRNPITITTEKMSDIHKFFATYGRLPAVCDACGDGDVHLSFKSPGGNDYYMLECAKCGATANFGIHKDGKGLFWKGDKMTVYKSGAKNADDKEKTADADVEETPF